MEPAAPGPPDGAAAGLVKSIRTGLQPAVGRATRGAAGLGASSWGRRTSGP